MIVSMYHQKLVRITYQGGFQGLLVLAKIANPRVHSRGVRGDTACSGVNAELALLAAKHLANRSVTLTCDTTQLGSDRRWGGL